MVNSTSLVMTFYYIITWWVVYHNYIISGYYDLFVYDVENDNTLRLLLRINLSCYNMKSVHRIKYVQLLAMQLFK